MHAKTDSEVTSLAPSSPTRSPRRQVYYVQSPSRDSHNGEKTTTSFHSTPVLSPVGSPPHSHSSVGHHLRESSKSGFSGSLKPGSRKISPNDGSRGGGQRKGQKPWKDQCDVIEEEGLLEDRHRGRQLWWVRSTSLSSADPSESTSTIKVVALFFKSVILFGSCWVLLGFVLWVMLFGS